MLGRISYAHCAYWRKSASHWKQPLNHCFQAGYAVRCVDGVAMYATYSGVTPGCPDNEITSVTPVALYFPEGGEHCGTECAYAQFKHYYNLPEVCPATNETDPSIEQEMDTEIVLIEGNCNTWVDGQVMTLMSCDDVGNQTTVLDSHWSADECGTFDSASNHTHQDSRCDGDNVWYYSCFAGTGSMSGNDNANWVATSPSIATPCNYWREDATSAKLPFGHCYTTGAESWTVLCADQAAMAMRLTFSDQACSDSALSGTAALTGTYANAVAVCNRTDCPYVAAQTYTLAEFTGSCPAPSMQLSMDRTDLGTFDKHYIIGECYTWTPEGESYPRSFSIASCSEADQASTAVVRQDWRAPNCEYAVASSSLADADCTEHANSTYSLAYYECVTPITATGGARGPRLPVAVSFIWIVAIQIAAVTCA